MLVALLVAVAAASAAVFKATVVIQIMDSKKCHAQKKQRMLLKVGSEATESPVSAGVVEALCVVGVITELRHL